MTVPDTTTDVTADALAGPWHAVLYDSGHWLINADRVEHIRDAPADVTISIVRRTGRPTLDRRLPFETMSGDRIASWTGFDDLDDLRGCWVQAQAMAAGLNQAAKEQQP